ncbi:hypothetical protein ACFE04_009924 [Oxalis oulophora]
MEWTREDDKLFENAIAMHWQKHTDNEANLTEEFWNELLSFMPHKDLEQLKQHYVLLVHDIDAIDQGLVPLPTYIGEQQVTLLTSSINKKEASRKADVAAGIDNININKRAGSGGNNYGGGGSGSGYSGFESSGAGHGSGGGGGGGRGSKSDQDQRRKGIPWTEDEHKQFLYGLEKYGKGDWRSISRNFVVSRTPTQVASHAQKYFIRLNSMNRDRRRSSIHDITSINNGGDMSPHQQAPITGQQVASRNPTPVIGTSVKHRPPPHVAGLGMYGAPVGHPVVAGHPGHMGSAVGTPVMMPPPGHHHPPYIVPVAYPMAPPTSMHQ